MEKLLYPFKVSGEIVAPPSKSDALRAIIASSLCAGPTLILNSGSNDDTGAAVKCLTALGAYAEPTEEGLKVCGKIKGGGNVDCKESGSALRFLLPVAAMTEKETVFEGSGKLPLRPISHLTAELQRHGAKIKGEGLPITVKGPVKGEEYRIPGNISSQYISGLMMALPLSENYPEIVIENGLESGKYVEMTVETLKKFGVIWQKSERGYKLTKKGYRTPGTYTVEGDWSGAAYFAAMAALGGEITVSGLNPDSLQPDRVITEILGEFGADVKSDGGKLKVAENERRPFSADVSQCPDLFSTLCILACGAMGESRIYNAKRLRYKESDRIEATEKLITSLGGEVSEQGDALVIRGKGCLTGGKAELCKDHRIVMSAAMAGTIAQSPVMLTETESVGKSYPDFFEDLGKVMKKA